MGGSTDSSVLERTASLLRLDSKTHKLEFKLGEKQVYVIGREPECDVKIYLSPDISRKHAEIKKVDDKTYQIKDLGSKNGTYINEIKIGDDYHQLKNNDKIRLGRYTSLVFKQGMS